MVVNGLPAAKRIIGGGTDAGRLSAYPLLIRCRKG